MGSGEVVRRVRCSALEKKHSQTKKNERRVEEGGASPPIQPVLLPVIRLLSWQETVQSERVKNKNRLVLTWAK